MVRAMSLLPDDVPGRLALVGAIRPEGLEDELRALDTKGRVDFLGRCGREDVLDLLGRARIGLNLLHDVPNYALQPYSSKMYEYMGAHMPFLASDFPAWREVIGPLDCARLVNPMDVEAIAESLRALLEDVEGAAEMGRRGYDALVERGFHWSREATRLREFYSNLLK